MSLILRIFNIKLIIFLSILLALVLIPMIVLYSRAPVLIVAEESFPDFYGKERIRKESSIASLILFRPVKTVFIADEAGDDIVSLAIGEVSKNPFCVLFPLRYARAAKLYHEQNPQIRAVLLEGRFSEDSNPSSYAISGELSEYFVFKTDVTNEFYKAGITAAAIYFYESESRVIDKTKPGDIAVFLEMDLPQVKETFSKAFSDFEEINRNQLLRIKDKKEKEEEKEKQKAEKTLEKERKALERKQKALERKERKTAKTPDSEEPQKKEDESAAVEPAADNKKIEDNVSALKETEKEEETIALPNIQFYTSHTQYTDKPNLSCVVLVDTAADYFDRNAGIPIIYFSWLNPIFLPKDVVVIVNDSPWVQAVQAVRMIIAGEAKGLILSEFTLSGSQKFEKRTLHKIRKTW